jgi:toxin-antitoxin system PIN domain toxin
MILPDINLLLYAYDTASQFQPKAARWWQTVLSGTEPVGLAPVVVFGFVRIGTSSRVFRHPLTLEEASGHVRSWLAQPQVQTLAPGPNHVADTLKLLQALGTAGNMVTDAQIAAIALEYDSVLHTADTDFLRFPGLRWVNPLTGVGSRTLRKGS